MLSLRTTPLGLKSQGEPGPGHGETQQGAGSGSDVRKKVDGEKYLAVSLLSLNNYYVYFSVNKDIAGMM